MSYFPTLPCLLRRSKRLYLPWYCQLGVVGVRLERFVADPHVHQAQFYQLIGHNMRDWEGILT